MRVTVLGGIFGLFAIALAFALDGWLRFGIPSSISPLVGASIVLLVCRPLYRFYLRERKKPSERLWFFLQNWILQSLFVGGTLLEMQSLGWVAPADPRMIAARTIIVACGISLSSLISGGHGDHKRDLREVFRSAP